MSATPRQPVALLLVGFSALACAGHSESPHGVEPREAAGAAGAVDPSDVADNPSTGGTLDRHGSSSLAGAARGGASSSGPMASEPESGAPGYDSLIHSGTRACANDDYCFGLECYAPRYFEPTVCLAPCESETDCLPSEACIGSAKLTPHCYARCALPSDCYRGFDCYDFSKRGQLICFPGAWAHSEEVGL